MTTDWGVKQSNADSWLRVNNEDQTGPMLLEDGIARQKVRKPQQLARRQQRAPPTLTYPRSTTLTMSASQSV